MIDTSNRLCTGCSACKAICPKHAIELIDDINHFKYPHIDSNKCINCGLCDKVCPLNKNINVEIEKVFAAKSKNDDIVNSSSSGGIFYEIAKYVLNNNGYICGAGFDDEFQVHHIIVDNFNDLPKLMTSKYVQSRMEDTYIKVKNLLENDNQVLFSGTPCQTNGLKSYFKKEYENLICVDIICHGVPSPRIWQYELNSNKKDWKISNINFRDKRIDWSHYGTSYKFTDGTEMFIEHNETIYSKAFLNDLCLRESCYQCKAKGNNRTSDLTLGDFWGVENSNISLSNKDRGISLIIAHNQKGLDVINKINVEYEEVSNEVLKYNPSYYKYSSKIIERNKYLSKVNELNYQKLTLKMTKVGLWYKCIRKVKNIFKKILKSK